MSKIILIIVLMSLLVYIEINSEEYRRNLKDHKGEA